MHAKSLFQALARWLHYINGAKLAGLETPLQHPAYERGGHVAAAYEKYAHRFKAQLWPTGRAARKTLRTAIALFTSFPPSS
ncbi:MAG TPA: hypothetical protein VN496_11605 [Burkholderiales bacterium]|nr:hypothetical protein [Burkholderiales bacterium]